LLFAVLSACVNQHKEVQTYRDVTDAGVARPASYQPGQSLTLERAMALANQDNEQIALQGENYLQAIIAKSRAVAAFLPTVSFQPSFTIEQQPIIASAFGPITPAVVNASAESSGFVANGNTWHSFQAPVVGSMELNLSSFPSLHGAEQVIEQQRQLLLDAQCTLLLNVAQTYYQVLRSEQQVVVLSNSLEVDAERLRQVEGRFQNHLALALEVSQTRAQAAATQVSLTQARNDVRNGRRTLAFLIGVAAVDGPLVDDVNVPQTLMPVEVFRDLAAANRQDLLAAQAQVRAAKYAVDAAISEYYPTVTLNVAGFLYREYFSQASKWDAILQANLPIFSAGIIEADVRETWSKLRQAALYEAELRRQIDQDVQTAYDNLITSGRQLANLHAEVQAAADARRQAGQLLDNGLALPLDVLTAQDTLLNAELNYTSEGFDRTVFYLDLLRIVGHLNPLTPRQWESPPRPATEPAGTPSTLPSDY